MRGYPPLTVPKRAFWRGKQDHGDAPNGPRGTPDCHHSALVLELLTVTSLFLFGPRRQRRAAGPVPRLTVVVPAHNEEGSIEDCVRSLLDSGRGMARVLVVAHNCGDATAQRAAHAGAELLVFNDIAARGKGHALRYGFKRALEGGAEAVLVVDADSIVSENLIPEVLRTLSEEQLPHSAATRCTAVETAQEAGWRPSPFAPSPMSGPPEESGWVCPQEFRATDLRLPHGCWRRSPTMPSLWLRTSSITFTW